MGKVRLDKQLVESDLVSTRERAKQLIITAAVTVNNVVITKPSYLVDANDEIVLTKEIPYVGKGGYKLEKAIKEFEINLTNVIMLDVGASTGGFTDCALQNGAKFVYALDVGSDQLSNKLRVDSRVLCIENQNFRYATNDLFKFGTPNFATVDVSFISLKHIIPKLIELTSSDAECVMLVKPQFEAGKEYLNHNGVVKSTKVYSRVLTDIVNLCYTNKLKVSNITFSPIKGGKGNIEFLLYAKKLGDEKIHNDKFATISNVINQALKKLK